MATGYTIVEGVQRSSTVKAPVTPPPGGGACKVVAEYEASSLAAASTINVCTIPAYSKWRLRQINNDAMGAATKIKVGYSGALADQLSLTDVSAAGVVPADSGGWRYVSTDTDVLATTEGTMTGSLQFEIEYFRSGYASAF